MDYIIVLGYPLLLYSNTLFVKDTVLFGSKTWRNPPQTEQETSSHLSSFHSAKGYTIHAVIRVRSKVSMILFTSGPYMLNTELQAMCTKLCNSFKWIDDVINNFLFGIEASFPYFVLGTVILV